jgi:hypothetical protein
MTTLYRGLYRLGSTECPTDIQVIDIGGNSLPLAFDDYVLRNILPPWESLPTEKQFQALESVRKLESNESAWVNPADIERCLDEGWVEYSTERQLVLTKLGRALLG